MPPDIFFYLLTAVLDFCCYAWAFSSCSKQGLLLVAVLGLFIEAASLVAEHWPSGVWVQELRLVGFQSLGSVAVAQGLRCSPASRISSTRDRTHVSCTGRQILHHCTTREVPLIFSCLFFSILSISAEHKFQTNSNKNLSASKSPVPRIVSRYSISIYWINEWKPIYISTSRSKERMDFWLAFLSYVKQDHV